MSSSEIEQLLREISGFLEQYGVDFWAEYVTERADELQSAILSQSNTSILYALYTIKKMYGGMGSFGDIYINPYAGHSIEIEQVSTVNRKFHELKTQLYGAVRDEIVSLQAQTDGDSTT